jgi:hypothetical protein
LETKGFRQILFTNGGAGGSNMSKNRGLPFKRKTTLKILIGKKYDKSVPITKPIKPKQNSNSNHNSNNPKALDDADTNVL